MSDQNTPLGRGRARGLGRGVYQHPPANPSVPHREPYRDAVRPPAPAPGRSYVGMSAKLQSDPSMSMVSSEGSSGRGIPIKMLHSRTSGSDPTKHIVYPEGRPDNLRGNLRPEANFPLRLLYTRPEALTSKVGTDGRPITCLANYFRLKRTPQWHIWQYRVDFAPNVEDIRHRRFLLAQLQLGGFQFDGTMLFVVSKIDDSNDVVEKTVTGRDETVYRITFKFTTLVSPLEPGSIQVMNLILRGAMKHLKLQPVGRNLYDPLAQINVDALKLSIWPGYITSIRQHEHDILLCAEISHKIMRRETVYDILCQVRTEHRDFRTKAEQTLLGLTVLTEYNNKTYRIDDIKWDKSPESTFDMKGEQVSFVDYYKRYNITIRDKKQPLLLTKPKAKDIRGKQLKPGEAEGEEDKETLLVPELCRVTGLTEQMKSNYRTMKEINRFTKIGPDSRIERLLKFNERLRNCPESIGHLTRWDLELEKNLVEIPARILPYPQLLFGNNRKVATDVSGDWTREFRNNSMFKTEDLKRWYVITTTKARRVTDDLIDSLIRAGRGMSMTFIKPRVVEMRDDRIVDLSNEISKCANDNPQLIMCVVSSNSADRYAAIKKRCYLDHGIPSQVVVQKTITPKDPTRGASGLMSVATKIAIQMNCKLGGLPWLVEIPLDGLMTIGYDVCHDPQDKKFSWGAMVATMDLRARNAEFFSAVDRHSKDIEMSNNLKVNVVRALRQFLDINKCLPKRVILYRDGVGDGQIPYVVENELKMIQEALNDTYKSNGIQEGVPFMYMIVSKRINTRIFFDKKNPPPGTCVDDVVTLPERYDFYLIPQTVREGTVTPSGFNIIHDTLGLPPSRVQILTFRFTYVYYNWSGTVRVPALCQYAHKLAFLASQSLRSNMPLNGLERTLYYL